MSSYIQKVLEAEKRRKSSNQMQARTLADTSHDIASASGTFKSLSRTRVDKVVMEKNKILPAIDDRSAVTAYKMLRTRVLHRMRSNNWRSLIVTSAGPAEGKSITASNLAVSISDDVNQSVVLVDLDLQHSTIALNFGLDADTGISDYLSGHASIDDILYTPEGMDRLAIIPNVSSVSNSSELITSPRMRRLLEWLGSCGPNTVAIFDMPPVLSCDDVLAFAPYTDAVLVIVSEGLTERDSFSRATEMIADCNLLGVVLNQSRERGNVTPYY